LRRERDAERDPDSKVKRREEERAFQREGPMLILAIIHHHLPQTPPSPLGRSNQN